MVIAIILILLPVCLYLSYCMYSAFSESNFDIINVIRYDKKGFFWCSAGIIGCLLGLYFCVVTPTSFIRNEYVHKNGTMTVVEYSLTGDSTINTNVMLPKTTYGTVKKVKFHSRLNSKIRHYYYTDVTVHLNDGRVLYKEFSGKRKYIKEGNGMSLTETFYPYYEMEFTFN